ncbi:putative HNHc nuclease [Paucilactobacillus nenjiangensis]|uniref:DUF968 domain-containing protein n=1 Tax=Paucilactobacillus nenjiangensis TaxID=1296540 RepID=A0A5P1X5N1_9LACO|nr:putative HNHc nuclease [Paucilactobacillus nenjiangensis]QER67598.1 hypothetical protein F0161_06820 [Paucilactobacillus nenjiangensis]
MQRSRAELFENDNGSYDVVIHLDQKPNLDHLVTVAGSTTQFYVDYEIADTRKARAAQRRLFFALIHDIANFSDASPEWLKELFYLQYQIYTAGKQISLADGTKSSVSDANALLDLVIDFMFEYNVPFKKGYELLTKDESFYLYQCCRHRQCIVCGEHADIHHIDVIGNGLDRTKVDHTKRHLMALCRVHHQEIEQIGPHAFSEKYHLPVTGIKLDVETLKKIGVRGDYSESERIVVEV